MKRPALLLACLLPVSVAAQSRLVVTPISIRVEVGGSRAVRTAAYDSKGVAMPPDQYQARFSVADSTVAVVDARGVVTGLKPGSTQLTVQVNDLARDVIVTVGAAAATSTSAAAGNARRISRIEVTPNPILLLPTERAHPAVTAVYSDSSNEVLRAATLSVFGNEATYDSVTGDIVGVSPGNAVLGVRAADGASASVPVNVAPAAVTIADSILLEEGNDDTIPVVVPAQHGRRLDHGFSWHADDQAVIRVENPIRGIIHGVAVGTAHITADGYGLSEHVPVRVYKHVDLVRFRPEPSVPLRLAVGGETTVTADALAADSSPVMARPPSWRVADTSVATFDARTHRLSGRRVGRTELECHMPNFAATVWHIEVVDGRLAIDRGVPRVVTIGSVTHASASYRDAQQASLGSPASVRWSSSDDAVLTADPSGALTAHRVGHALVGATARAGVADSILVFVTGDALATKRVGESGSQLVTFVLGAPKPIALADSSQMTRDGAWSPDRTRIAYVSDGGSRGAQWAVYVADADGTNAHPITSRLDGFEHPTWSPDGTSIAVSMGRIGRKMQLVALNPDSLTLAPKPIATDKLSLRWPAYDSGGRSVIAVGERGDERHLYRVRAGGEVAITTGTGSEWHPTVLADGSIIYLADSTGKGNATRVMRQPAGGGVPTVVIGADVLPGLTDAAMSPDGQRLLLVVTKTVKGQKAKRSALYVVDKPGSSPVPLADGSAYELIDPAL